MSSIAAYIGSPLYLETFLATPDHSLFRQATSSGEENIGNGGFGVGWYNPDKLASAYISTTPIWQDSNLPDLMSSLRADMWIGHLNTGLTQHSLTIENSQPQRHDHLLWAFDGHVADFRTSLRPHCLRYLSPQIESGIKGHTESEYLFALLRQRMSEADGVSAPAALAEIISTLEVALRDFESQINIVLSDSQHLYAVRHATRMPCRPLYFTENDKNLFSNGKAVASAPMTSNGDWQEIPEQHLLVLTRDRPAELFRL